MRNRKNFQKTIGRISISLEHDKGGKSQVLLSIENGFDPERNAAVITIDESYDMRYMFNALLSHGNDFGRA